MRRNGGTLEVVNIYVYLDTGIDKNGGSRKDVENRLAQERNVEGATNVLGIKRYKYEYCEKLI